MSWADDPELIATFRAEVDDRLASLQRGLLSLESGQPARSVVTGLFRDAHTVKGSARMLGLDAVLQLAHRMEDVLGALRDARLAVRTDVVDLLLTTCDAVQRCLPGSPLTLSGDRLVAVLDALTALLDGTGPVPVPTLDAVTDAVPAVSSVGAVPVGAQPVGGSPFGAPPPRLPPAPTRPPATIPGPATIPAPAAPPSLAEGVPSPATTPAPPTGDAPEAIRVTAGKVYELLDLVGEAELAGRRAGVTVAQIHASLAEQEHWAAVLRDLAGPSGSELSEPVRLAVHRLAESAERVRADDRRLRDLVEVHTGQLAAVRAAAMQLAMVPVGRAVAPFPRLVRDTAARTGHQVRLEVLGTEVELDKQVLDAVADSLKHLVTNAVDHGCEPAEVRVAAGKPAVATVRLQARATGSSVTITVTDDGPGIDLAAVHGAAVRRGLLTSDAPVQPSTVLPMLFEPALSTRSEVTDVSGRGVGLDVVRGQVQALGGAVDVSTEPGVGTTFTLTLPVTLGVLRCLIARVGPERYALGMPGVVETVLLRDADRHEVAGSPVLVRDGISVPLLDLGAALDVAGRREPVVAVVVRHAGGSLAWAVDALEGERELVVKDLGGFLGRLRGIVGATIDGDGSVVPLLELRELADELVAPGVSRLCPVGAGPAVGEPLRVLVVEDSVGVRELERVILTGAGYEVLTAVDGLDAAEQLRGLDRPVDLVLTDVEMPGMDGLELTGLVRSTPGWEQVPVVIMTSRGEDRSRERGLRAGADAYLLKQEFDQQQLVDTVRRLVGA